MKILSSRTFYSNFLEREGWEINDLSPLSWQFLRFYDLGCSKVLGVLKQNLVSRKLKYLNFDIMRCSSFLNLVFRKRRFCCRKLIVISCLQFADCYIWPRIFVLWCDWCVLITCYGFFLKNFLSRNHGVVENMCSFSKSYL